MGVSRRTFLTYMLGMTAASAVPLPTLWAMTGKAPPDRTLSFYNTHTAERLTTCYCRDGCYVPDALNAIDHILRDHRTGAIKAIDTGLLDLLHRLSKRVGGGAVFHVISGYRSPETNKKLRMRSNGVAKKSLHMKGKAIDIRLSDYDTAALRKIAVSLKGGGVGYYARSNFIHLDVGRVRTW